MFEQTEAFSGFSISDAAATRAFYGDTLGMHVTDVPGMERFGMLELHIANGATILMYQKADHQPATFTVLSFPVEDIDAAVARLNQSGIEMVKYDAPEMHQDDKGIARGLSTGSGPDIAWFTDPSGNNLAVLQTQKTAASN